MDKRGISKVLVIFLIFIAVSALSVLLVKFIPLINESLEIKQMCSNADLSIETAAGYTCYDSGKKIAGINIKKGYNDVDISGIEFILSFEGTSSKQIKESDLSPNAVKTFYLPLDEDIEKVSIAPVIKFGDKEETCDITSTTDIRICNLDETTFQQYFAGEYIGFWRFEDDINDGMTDDLTGQSNGFLSGGSFVSGRNNIGQALYLDGDDYVDCGSNDILNSLGDEISIELWVKPEITDSPEKMTIVQKSDDWGIFIEDGEFHFFVDTSDSGGSLKIVSAPISDGAGKWYHIIGTYGSPMKLYINGDLKDKQDQSGSVNNNIGVNLIIGSKFKGAVDEVKIFNHRISVKETEIYNYTEPVEELPEEEEEIEEEPEEEPENKTISYYRFIEKISETQFEKHETRDISPVSLNNGNIFLAYMDYLWFEGYFVIYDYLGNQIKSPERFDVPVSETSAATLKNGNVLIAYRKYDGRFVIYNQNGNLVKEKTIFNDGNTFDISTITLKNGNILIAYRDEIDNNKGKFVIYNQNGSLVKSETEFENSSAWHMSAEILDNGNVFIAYYDGGDNKGKFVIYNQNGDLIQSEMIFNIQPVQYISTATLKNGNILIAYRDVGDSDKGKFVIYTPKSNLAKSETEFEDSFTISVSTTTLADGNILIAYSDHLDGRKGKFVIYNQNGDLIQSEMIFNDGNTYYISTITLNNGNILIAYRDGGLGGPGKFVIWGLREPGAISNCQELQNIENNLSADYYLTQDIDCSGFDFNPIGDHKNMFTGTFDGKGYVIKNLYINDSSLLVTGLFAYVYTGLIKNVGLINANIQGKDNIGALAGIMDEYSSINNSYCIGNINGKDVVGGLVGHARRYSNIFNSYFVGNINARNLVGGIEGWAQSGIHIFNSYSIGNISGGKDVGGLVGYYEVGHVSNGIDNSFFSGDLTGMKSIGGLFGSSNQGIYIRNSYYYDSGDSVRCWGTIYGGAMDIDCHEIIEGSGGECYFQGSDVNQKEPMAQWDFENTWKAVEKDYPHLIDETLGLRYSNETCILQNIKKMSKYSDKQAFLVSDENWKNILPFVPVAVWTGNENCQKGFGASDNVCVYPFLVYHEEDKIESILPNSEDNSEPDSKISPNEGLTYKPAYSVNGKSLVRFYLKGKSREEFLKLDLDIINIKGEYVDVVLDNKQKDFYEDSGYDIETIPINSYDLFKEETISEETGYHTYESMVKEMNELAEEYSDIAQLYEIGQSIEMRSILAMKISDNAETDEDEKKILVVGNHHAREIMTVEVPLFMINYLLENYNKDAEIKKIVDNYELWFIPMVNPDGHVKVEEGDIWWRKNTRDNNGDGIIDGNDGVDLNRNYGYMWGYNEIGSSSNPASSEYRGADAFSEPETQAIRDLVLQYDFDYVLDYHSYGGYILYPWGHIGSATSDDALFRNLASNFKKFLPNYFSGQIYHTLYPINGNSIDWFYGEQNEKNKIIAFNFELNPDDDFRPSESKIRPTCEKQMKVLLNLTGYPIKFKIKDVIDADSIIYFMQQYSPDNVAIIGETTQELDDLLIANQDLGSGLNQNQIEKISSEDYFSYWEYFEDVVYVEDNYELALLASTYASLINAPLVIQDTNSDTNNVLGGKNIICVGDVSRKCDETYNLEELQQKYLEKTNTDKIILVNPDDLGINAQDLLYPRKTSESFRELYSKTSLMAPVLASAKYELIITDDSKDIEDIDEYIENFFRNNYEGDISHCLPKDDCAEGFKNNPVNMIGARNSVMFFLTGEPDLIPEFSPSGSILVDTSNEINIFVNNIGFDKAENCILELYELVEKSENKANKISYSSSSSEMVLIGRAEIGTILEDESKLAIINWAPTKVGPATLYYNVSTSSKESNTNNNDGFHDVDVSGPSPDLKLFVEYPPKMLLNSVNKFNISISNKGTKTAKKFSIDFYETYWDGNGEKQLILINQMNFTSLNPNTTQGLVFEFVPTERRWYDFLIIAELEEDLNKLDNEKSFSIKAFESEPYIGYSYYIPSPILVNETSTIKMWLRNEGFETAQNSILDIYVVELFNNWNTYLIESKNIGDITDKEIDLFFNWTPTKVGEYYLIFNVSYEYSGGKENREIWTWREVKLPGPDMDVWFFAEDVELGQENKAEIYFSNDGTETAKNIIYSFYDNNKLVAQNYFSSLDPREAQEDNVYWTPEGIGLHELKVLIECENDVNPKNNEERRDIYVYELKNVTFEIINNSADYVKRYVGIAYDWDYPETIDLVTEPTLFTIPDMETDVWIINSENMVDENTEYAITQFIDSDLHDKMFIKSVDYKNVREEGAKRLYRIYANEVFWNYDRAAITFNYPDYHVIGVEKTDNLTIYYCQNWDFDSEVCLSEWKESYWIDKTVRGTRFSIRTDLSSVEAFAIGEPIIGDSIAQLKSGDKIDFSKIIDEYQNKQRFLGSIPEAPQDYPIFSYRIMIPGFFYNCNETDTNVDISFNGENIGGRTLDCYNELPMKKPEDINLGSYTYRGVRNITLNFDGDLIFYNSSELIKIRKEESYFSFGENNSVGTQIIGVNVFNCIGDSSFNFENKDYTYFVVNAESVMPNVLDVYVNDILVGSLELINSTDNKKGRGFKIPDEILEAENFKITLKPRNPETGYLADVKIKTDFDPYYLTIIASPDAIPFEDNRGDEMDFQRYGSLDDDREGEFSVGRIMGLTLSDISAYLSRILFYNEIEREKGATIMMVGDYYSQSIPKRTYGTGWCKCFFDVECDELFARYAGYFEPFETCNQDLIDGVEQERPSDCEETERLHNNMFYHSSFSHYSDHGSEDGWPAVDLLSDDLEDLNPQFSLSLACSTCEYSSAKSDLFCTNMIRRGAIGYIGAVKPIYGNHFLNEFLDETLINNESMGYAFKIGKNKEARYDWATPNTPSKTYLKYEYGVGDLLIGDPTFDGRIGK